MNSHQALWIELAVIVPICGAVWTGRLKDAEAARKESIALAATALAALLAAWLGFALDDTSRSGWSISQALTGTRFLAIDSLNAPLLPLIALIYLVTILATPRTKVRRFSFAWTLIAEGLALATFACREPWLLIGLLAVGVYPPYRELKARHEDTRVYLIHMSLFLGLLIAGQGLLETWGSRNQATPWAALPLLLAVLIRSGIVPFHCWVPDLFERAAFGTSLTHFLPMTGVYAAVRLLIPAALPTTLQALEILALVTALYAAGMALVQTDIRRFVCYQFLSQSALVMVGIDMNSPIGLTGGLSVWLSVGLALAGFGLTLRAIEARTGRLSLDKFHGLYDQLPTLAAFFLLTGLACVGFPGTFGFIGIEMLIDAAVSDSPYVGLTVVCATALNGITLMRAYFSLFTGTRHAGTVSLRRRPRERFAVLVLAALIISGGLLPQPGILSRYAAAQEILAGRDLQAGSQAK